MTLRISWSTQTTSLASSGDLEARSVEHGLVFDCVTTETHEGTSVLTEHAVESGAPISDHKRANPDRVTIEAIVSNTPLGAPPESGYGASGITAEVRKGADQNDQSGQVVIFSAEFDRISDAVATLRRLRLENTPVTVSTRVHTYDDCQIVGVTTPREISDGDSVRFQIEVQSVRIAQSRTVDAPQPREPRGRPPTDRGGQEAREEQSSALQRGRDDYNRRREAGESREDAALGAIGAAFGG